MNRDGWVLQALSGVVNMFSKWQADRIADGSLIWAAIQGGVSPLLSRELHDILEDSNMVSHVPQDTHTAELLSLFAASSTHDASNASKGDTRRQKPAQPWNNQVNTWSHPPAAAMSCFMVPYRARKRVNYGAMPGCVGC